MGHVVSKVVDGVKSAADDVGHVVSGGLHDVSKAADVVSKAVVTVGDKAAGVVDHIPVVGDAIGDAIKGATNIASDNVKLIGSEANALRNPIGTLHAVEHAVKHPLDFVKTSLTKGEKYADNAAKVMSIVNPEAAVLANNASQAMRMGTAVLSGNAKHILNTATNIAQERAIDEADPDDDDEEADDDVEGGIMKNVEETGKHQVFGKVLHNAVAADGEFADESEQDKLEKRIFAMVRLLEEKYGKQEVFRIMLYKGDGMLTQHIGNLILRSF